MITKKDEITQISMKRPHIVILGAGASIAACPNGDRNGLKLPSMQDFIKTLGFDNSINPLKNDFKLMNFEDFYNLLTEKDEYKKIREELESKVYDYFKKINIPKEPTIYDYIFLSLRKKDIVATFNWDPFLYYACLRNHKHASLPHTAYLHGNVAIGYCLDHKNKGMIGYNCSVCNKPYEPSKLLFPILEKIDIMNNC